MIGKSEKCFSPWFGYLVILLVCIIIAGAIFFETKGGRHSRRRHQPVPQKPAAMQQVAMPDEQAGVDTSKGKVLF